MQEFNIYLPAALPHIELNKIECAGPVKLID